MDEGKSDGKRILCVKYAGDEDLSKGLEAALREAGYTVVEVPRSQIMAAGQRFVLIIQLGLSANDVGGCSFLEYLKLLYPQLDVLVFTGHEAQEVREKVTKRGGIYCPRLIKPATLVQIVGQVLKTKAAPS